jgi:hypothetical protein
MSNPAPQALTISNSGGTLNWEVSSTQPWINLSNTPTGTGTQTLTGTGAQTIWVQVATAGLTALTLAGALTITSPGSASPAQTTGVSLSLGSLAGSGAQHYVATNGSPSGNGTITSPWDLQTALNQPAGVNPGDVIWIMGGTYQPPSGGAFNSYLNGTSTSPIIVRNYNSQRATINAQGGQMGLYVNGSYSWFWGLEVMDSTTTRSSPTPGDTDPNTPSVFVVGGTGNHFINMIVHDTADGFFAGDATINTVFNGNLVYNNGWLGPDRGHGHGFYIQNQSPSLMSVVDNIIFQGFGEGIQCYGSPSAAIQNFLFDGNTIFNSGVLTNEGDDYNLLIGGGANGPQNITVTNNYTFHTPSSLSGLSSLSWGFDTAASNLFANNDYWIGGNPAIDINAWTGATFTNQTAYSIGNYVVTASSLQPSTYTWGPNTYFQPSGIFSELNSQDESFINWESLTGLDGNSKWNSAPPTGTWVFLRPNQYETGRANITIYNWGLLGSISVNLSSVLSVGAPYRIFNAQNFFGSPVLSGSYNGGSVSVPMTGLTAAPAIGNVAAEPQPTEPLFGAFVLLSP